MNLLVGLLLGMTAAKANAARPDLKLPEAVVALEETERGNRAPAERLGIEVAGWNWFQVVRIAGQYDRPGLVAVIVSRNLAGEVFLFRPTGESVARRTVNEPISYQPVDLGESNLGLMIEEVDEYGTGIRGTRYHLYLPSVVGIKELWKGDASWSWDLGQGKTEAGRGLIRLEWRWAKRPILLHIVDGTREGHTIRTRAAWEFVDGKMRPAPFPARPGA